MKKKIKQTAILAVLLLFGTAGTAFAQNTGGTFTLTDIPSRFNGMYAMVMAEGRTVVLYGARRIVMSRWEEMFHLPRISGGRVSIPMWIFNERTDEFMRYNGNHTVELEVIISDLATIECCCDGEIAWVLFESVTFRNGSATRSWRNADDVDW